MATFERPTNTFAEQVVRLRSENNDLETQIETLQAKKTNNLIMISELNQLATWETVEEPDTEPIVDQTPEDL